MQLSLNFHLPAERWINLLSLMITLGLQLPLITGRDRLEADDTERPLWVVLCRSCPGISLVKTDARRMQMGKRIHAIAHSPRSV